MYSPSDYTYELPDELIAQKPATQRDGSRLLLLRRESGALSHHRFHDLGRFLVPGDVLVVNDTRVIPARIVGHKETGGRVELLVLDYARALQTAQASGELSCECLVKTARPVKPGAIISFGAGLRGRIGDFRDGVCSVDFFFNGDFDRILNEIGSMPLPPYIHRAAHDADTEDKASYQTIYASKKGAAAAPTAGLHFTEQLLGTLRDMGVTIAPITLHVGYGTFRPVKVTDIREHRMHTEDFFISESTADVINRARQEGRRIVAVGTTCVRTLEYASDESGRIRSGNGQCDLFIYPGFEFRVVTAMVTNFHLPGSTLMMLVSAFAGRERILTAYRTAVAEKYRFFSYGDAMMIV